MWVPLAQTLLAQSAPTAVEGMMVSSSGDSHWTPRHACWGMHHPRQRFTGAICVTRVTGSAAGVGSGLQLQLGPSDGRQLGLEAPCSHGWQESCFLGVRSLDPFQKPI